ncbi:hypothetical protein Patl1_19685 [Pistacia atlantica]|uniref:Uncharacterized protein n=1 Tax=Pistacia atlantica TaxID=434234 RepID=A0ACC1C1C4_9ROSI|nr:hypothetical protein Patl1_19685 [Pistacia atlantica]
MKPTKEPGLNMKIKSSKTIFKSMEKALGIPFLKQPTLNVATLGKMKKSLSLSFMHFFETDNQKCNSATEEDNNPVLDSMSGPESYAVSGLPDLNL